MSKRFPASVLGLLLLTVATLLGLLEHGVPRGASVCDLGTCSGSQAIGMALMGYRVVGTDVSRTALEKAERTASKYSGLDLTFVYDDVLESKLEPQSFDVIFDRGCFHSLYGWIDSQDYVEAVHWAQAFAMENRRAMMDATLDAMHGHLPAFTVTELAVNCHHNYVAREHHKGSNVWLTRKGAVRARKGDLGIIPGSMGARSYIVRGKGNAESFHSCSHGAGRAMSRSKARRKFTVEDHAKATAGIECRKDEGVIDETPGAYKPIDKVMEAQRDLVERAKAEVEQLLQSEAALDDQRYRRNKPHCAHANEAYPFLLGVASRHCRKKTAPSGRSLCTPPSEPTT